MLEMQESRTMCGFLYDEDVVINDNSANSPDLSICIYSWRSGGILVISFFTGSTL
jgi:hypothetical protein